MLAAIREANLVAPVINLMVMDYGPASASACVVKAGRCDMGASAIQAARNLNAHSPLAFSRAFSKGLQP